LDFFWKNNSLRSDIFFRQKIQQPPRADGHWRVHGLKDAGCKKPLNPAFYGAFKPGKYSVFRIPYSVFRIPYSVFRIPYSVFRFLFFVFCL